MTSYESDGLRIINEQCQSLPECPVCGNITSLDEIRIERVEAFGGGEWVGWILRCVSSASSHLFRRTRQPGPLCTFAVPVTLQERVEK